MDPLPYFLSARSPSVWDPPLLPKQEDDDALRLVPSAPLNAKITGNSQISSPEHEVVFPNMDLHSGLTPRVSPNGEVGMIADLNSVPIKGLQSRRQDRMTDQNVTTSLSTPGTSHVPLEDADIPNSHGSGHRQKFRVMMDWINEIERRRPDLEYAKQKGWTQHRKKLIQRIRYLESQIKHRLRKLGNTSVFEDLIPKYPQLFKYLDSVPRRAHSVTTSLAGKEEEIEKKAMVASSTHPDDRILAHELSAPSARQSSRTPKIKVEEIEIIEISD
ncbi:hypothetical protein F4776DRAFT_302614 [Hypoxylon sp. NC0597]|nr:hypothetical protein F4776DRAFT_302614 [Hypoxylon sp. NC0597]